MTIKRLKDKTGKILGTVKVLSSGKHELRDSFGALKGTYDPATDVTRDKVGALYARGNLLVMLL